MDLQIYSYPDGFYIFDESTHNYLHQDGILRRLTVNDRIYSGFYNTRKQAEEVLNNYMKRTNMFDMKVNEYNIKEMRNVS